jgi:phosphatidylglycerophosphate synthase
MVEYLQIRKTMYDVQLRRWGDLLNIKSPYSLCKAIYYIETASLFLFITQNIIKSPNFITFLYALTGVIGPFLLCSSQQAWFYTGALMVFTKGTFDWADGPLARRLNKSSFVGGVLDSYGAYVSDVAFRLVFIYYTLGYFSELMFLFPVFSFMLVVTDFRLFTDSQYLTVSLDASKNKIRDDTYHNDIRNDLTRDGILKKWYLRYVSFLDERARSIDLLLLILVIDFVLGYDLSNFLLVASAFIIIRAVIMYVAGVYFVFKVYKE